MNPLIKKQFLLEAWNYNNSLEEPFTVSYAEPHEYFYKNNWIKFSKTAHEKTILSGKQDKYYYALVEKEINNEKLKPNSRKLIISGEDSFLEPYFKHFFIQHPELQSDLLKFFNGFLSYKYKPTEFLKNFDKKEVEPFLININHWYVYNNDNLQILHDFMMHNQFNEGFRVSIFKKYVDHNLKIINKTPALSQGLEEFLSSNYYNSFAIITTNVVAIQNRLAEVNEENYFNSFSNQSNYCLHENIQTDSLLKTLQIAGWSHSSYNAVILMYHQYLVENKDFKIKAETSQNLKEMEVFITMKTNDFTLDNYKNDLLTLFKFYRSNPNQKLQTENTEQVLFNKKLNESLPLETSRTKTKKI